jgi:hypothetical protein
VRFTQRAAALSVQHCHCARCRKLYGQLSAAGAVIDRSDIEITGTANLVSYRTSSTFENLFCGTCGCHLFAYEDSEPRLMYFFPATLDGGVHPGHPADKESHIYVGSKAVWDTVSGSLPKYDTTSPDEIITGTQRGR